MVDTIESRGGCGPVDVVRLPGGARLVIPTVPTWEAHWEHLSFERSARLREGAARHGQPAAGGEPPVV